MIDVVYYFIETSPSGYVVMTIDIPEYFITSTL